MTTMDPQLRRRMADALRVLSADAVEHAKSGHPGAPMGMAEMAEVVWSRHLRHNPADPHWADRDRFVLSNGHASMLLYSLLHLTGYALSIDEIKRFRRLHSLTPGHPEVDVTPGVETTTGPLGQGLANAVGMALAEKQLAAEFNRPGHAIVDHLTWVFLGDGCLMEGVSHEACSLAGTLRLSKLIALYDDNGISIDGKVEGWFTDDTPARFRAYGWNVIANVDGHDADALDAAISAARTQADAPDGKPTLICCRTTIGRGAPHKAGSADVHGSALGADELRAMREQLGWTHAPFEIPQDLRDAWDARARGAAVQATWSTRFADYARAHPELGAEFLRRMQGDLPPGFDARVDEALARLAADAQPVATRRASQLALNAFAPALPELFGGSADLTGSNLTDFTGHVNAGRDRPGNHLSYGVREFGMAAMMNGIALHGGLLPYAGTFLTFSDYSRNAIRMAALMKRRVIHVFTHDSIGLGEDGPTHQSVEHVPSLRLIPNLDVWRPADTLETAVAWAAALRRRDGPSVLALSRQSLPVAADASLVAGIARGGYVLRDAPGARAVVIATGSEVAIALQAQQQLAAQGVPVRVVSMPSTTVFDRQSAAYQAQVLPMPLPTVAVEAAHPDFWRKYVGRSGAVIGIASFGESAPAPDLYRHFGLTAERVAEAVLQGLDARQSTTT
ncbi:MAG: transketolase [Burkholderiales bacterium]